MFKKLNCTYMYMDFSWFCDSLKIFYLSLFVHGSIVQIYTCISWALPKGKWLGIISPVIARVGLLWDTTKGSKTKLLHFLRASIIYTNFIPYPRPHYIPYCKLQAFLLFFFLFSSHKTFIYFLNSILTLRSVVNRLR